MSYWFHVLTCHIFFNYNLTSTYPESIIGKLINNLLVAQAHVLTLGDLSKTLGTVF